MEKVFLTDICDIQYGYAFDSKLFSDTKGKPIIRIRDIVRGYSETYTTEECPGDYIIHNDDILIGMDGEFNIALWKGGEAVLNQRVCKLIPHNEICKNYIFYYMPIALKAIEDKTPFVTVKHLSAKELNKIELPLPTYEMQNRIANSLFNLDELIEKRKKQLSKLDELVKARFVELFGDIQTGEYKFETRKLGEVAVVGSSHRVFTTEFVEEGIPFYRGTEIGELANGIKPENPYRITKEHYDRLASDETKPKVGDLLMPSICNKGQVWMVDTDEPFYYKDGRVLCISPNRKLFNCKYLEQFMREKTLVEYPKLGSGSTFAEFKIFLLKDIDILIPPIELQNQFAAFVEQTDKSKLEIQKSLEKLELLKKALMQKYFG